MNESARTRIIVEDETEKEMKRRDTHQSHRDSRRRPFLPDDSCNIASGEGTRPQHTTNASEIKEANNQTTKPRQHMPPVATVTVLLLVAVLERAGESGA